MVSSRLLKRLRESNNADAMFGHGLTYSSHPVGCAVALKNLELLEGACSTMYEPFRLIFRKNFKHCVTFRWSVMYAVSASWPA